LGHGLEQIVFSAKKLFQNAIQVGHSFELVSLNIINVAARQLRGHGRTRSRRSRAEFDFEIKTRRHGAAIGSVDLDCHGSVVCAMCSGCAIALYFVSHFDFRMVCKTSNFQARNVANKLHVG
jgi:hypothetical protein